MEMNVLVKRCMRDTATEEELVESSSCPAACGSLRLFNRVQMDKRYGKKKKKKKKVLTSIFSRTHILKVMNFS